VDDGSAMPRRSRRFVIGGICVVLAVAAGSCLGEDPAPPDPTPSAGPDSGPHGDPVPSPVPLERPTRGSLASDSDFVDAVRALPWSSGRPETLPDGTVLESLPEPPLEQRTVLFAGDVPDGRWAVVIGPLEFGPVRGAPPEVPTAPELAVAVFTGPPDAAPGQLTHTGGISSAPADWTPALLDATTGTLLVVAEPGDQVEVSDRPEIAADGTGTRKYREVETTDGIAIVRLSPRGHYNWASTYRIVRQGRPRGVQFPWPVTNPAYTAPDLSIDFPRAAPSPTGRAAATWTAEQILAEVGLPSTVVQVTAQWVGTMPDWGAGDVAVVTVTLPGGAVVVAAQLSGPDLADGPSIGGICGRAVLPAGPPASRRVYALTCDVFDEASGRSHGTNLVVVAPRNVTLVRTYSRNRTFLSEHPATDGIVVAPLPQNTDTVEALGPGGVTLGRVELLGYADSFAD
jgi:hypothetical protein